MTQDELDALADVTPGFGMRETVIGGKKLTLPVAQGYACALFQGPDDGLHEDRQGRVWTTGWLDDLHVKRRFP